MQEEFIKYVWKFQLFLKQNLKVCSGDTLDILTLGYENENSGPDFLNAQVIVGTFKWYGHVEIHINSSDWYTHNHHLDESYNNVVLHVVWNNDKIIRHSDGTTIPTLELKNRMPLGVYNQYIHFKKTPHTIPCTTQIHEVPEIIRHGMLDKVLYQRVHEKYTVVYQLLKENCGDWQETAYQLLAYNIGGKVNSAALLTLARSIPYKVILKVSHSITEIEAILFGVSGMLPGDDKEDDYIKTLQETFKFIKNKNSLPDSSLSMFQWKFFRLRPANFPTIRIAQLTQILYRNTNLFDVFINTPVQYIKDRLSVVQSYYWRNHYTFGKKSSSIVDGFGQSSINSIIINTIIPLLVAYSKVKNDQNYIEKATSILEDLPAEGNKIINLWIQNGFKIKTAFDSQGCIQLYNNFCSQKRCLDCDIGLHILKKNLQ